MSVAYLLLYVDDMLVAGSSMKEVQQVKDDLRSGFDMKDLGAARKILGMNIVRDRKAGRIWLGQSDYILRMLKRFKVDNLKETATPLAQHFKLSMDQKPKNEKERKEMELISYVNIIGSVMYAMICTRPDIAHVVSLTSRFMADHGKEHWAALKWLLKYIKGVASLGILYGGGSSSSGEALMGFSDSDFAGNVDNRRSQSGYVFTCLELQ